jgi:hypothetical protein
MMEASLLGGWRFASQSPRRVASSGRGAQLRREVLALFGGDHPADDVAAEQVDNQADVREHVFLQGGELGIVQVCT